MRKHYTKNVMNVYVIALIIAIVLGVTSLFFGYVRSMSKPFDSNQESSIDVSKTKQQQKEQAQDVEAQRRAYMDDIKQKMRDSQRH
jgi:hypothetical protein